MELKTEQNSQVVVSRIQRSLEPGHGSRTLAEGGSQRGEKAPSERIIMKMIPDKARVCSCDRDHSGTDPNKHVHRWYVAPPVLKAGVWPPGEVRIPDSREAMDGRAADSATPLLKVPARRYEQFP